MEMVLIGGRVSAGMLTALGWIESDGKMFPFHLHVLQLGINMSQGYPWELAFTLQRSSPRVNYD